MRFFYTPLLTALNPPIIHFQKMGYVKYAKNIYRGLQQALILYSRRENRRCRMCTEFHPFVPLQKEASCIKLWRGDCNTQAGNISQAHLTACKGSPTSSLPIHICSLLQEMHCHRTGHAWCKIMRAPVTTEILIWNGQLDVFHFRFARIDEGDHIAT